MLILVGPSASGKTQAVVELIKKYQMKKLVTNTTRPMRTGEKDGIDYYFRTKEDFEQKIKDNYFLEYVNYNNNYYGTSYESISSDKVVILEPKGVITYKEKLGKDACVIYLKCSINERIKRMQMRGDSEENIQKRIKLDEEYFNASLEPYTDFIIDTDKLSIDEMTDLIYKDYLHAKTN